MKEVYEVTYHFSSGETMKVNYSKDKLLGVVEALKRAWNQSHSANEEWGINFAHVTHYQVKEAKIED